MAGLPRFGLLLRFFALTVVIFCFVILSRESLSPSLAVKTALFPAVTQTKAPGIKTLTQPESPLVISSPRMVSWDERNLEVAMELVNVSGKPIRAYAIKQAVENETQSAHVSFVSLDASNKGALQPNQLTTTFDVYQPSSPAERPVVFSVDYVEFSDGTTWGPDSLNWAERSEGQRAAISILSKRLLKILDDGKPRDVMSAIKNGETKIEPPANRSENWKEGFRFGCRSIEQHLKRAQMKGRVDQELRELAETFKKFQ